MEEHRKKSVEITITNYWVCNYPIRENENSHTAKKFAKELMEVWDINRIKTHLEFKHYKTFSMTSTN